jgi:hypothetical protein
VKSSGGSDTKASRKTGKTPAKHHRKKHGKHHRHKHGKKHTGLKKKKSAGLKKLGKKGKKTETPSGKKPAFDGDEPTEPRKVCRILLFWLAEIFTVSFGDSPPQVARPRRKAPRPPVASPPQARFRSPPLASQSEVRRTTSIY